MILERIPVILALAVMAISFSGCDSEPEPGKESPAVPPEVIATYRGGEIRAADLDEFLLAQPAGERFPAPGMDQLSWLEAQVGQLFLTRLLLTPQRIGQLSSEPGFQAKLSQRLQEELGNGYSGDEAARIREQTTRRLAWETIRQQALLDFLESLPGEPFLEFFNSHQHLFLTDPQVALTIFSWQVSGDPMRSLSGPMRFADALRSNRSESNKIWDRESQREEVGQETLPLAGLSTLTAQRPDLAMLNLSSDIKSGDVVGPYRHQQELLVVLIDTYVPQRQLSFAEARPRIADEFLGQENQRLFTRWQEKWAVDYNLKVFPDHLASFDPGVPASTPGPEPADQPTEEPAEEPADG